MPSEFVFHELWVDPQQFAKTPSPKGPPERSAPGYNPQNAVGAGVKILAKAMIALQEYGTKRNEERHLESDAFVAKLRQAMSSNGVVVEIDYDQWKTPDAVGNQPKLFVGAWICGSGGTPGEVLERYFSSDRLSAAPLDGWARAHKYLWVTRQ